MSISISANMKLCVIILLLLCVLLPESSFADNYPENVQSNLVKAGKNSEELKKVLTYYKNEPQKLKAACFLIGNMDIHSSQSYYWVNETKQKIPFNEFEYVNYEKAIQTFNKISSANKLTPVKYTTSDLTTVKADYLIKNIDEAFVAWKSRWATKLSFEMFCEYILPYRIMDEPFTEWRNSYKSAFVAPLEKCKNLYVREVCTFLTNEYRNWFTDIFGFETKKEPQDVLSPQQILFRRQGYCEDMANWGVYMLRTLGIASCVDFTPYWATSTGGHFWQVAFGEAGENIPFFMGDDTSAEFFMRREPSKVLRITYSKRKESPASFLPEKDIPDCFLRRSNFIDVTNQYWKTYNIPITLYPAYANEKVSYVAVFNGGEWRIAWWAKVAKGKATFERMSCGVVYLPFIYKNGQEIPAGDPYLLKQIDEVEQLKADKAHLQTLKIEQKQNYLIFRPNAKYSLYYWDSTGKWISLGVQTPGAAITPQSVLYYNNVPYNALCILIPEYSAGKERPFTVGNNGEMDWW